MEIVRQAVVFDAANLAEESTASSTQPYQQ